MKGIEVRVRTHGHINGFDTFSDFLHFLSVMGCQPDCSFTWKAELSADMGYNEAMALRALKGQINLFFNFGSETT